MFEIGLRASATCVKHLTSPQYLSYRDSPSAFERRTKIIIIFTKGLPRDYYYYYYYTHYKSEEVMPK